MLQGTWRRGDVKMIVPMASDQPDPSCRLCGAPLHESELSRQLCGICDEYAQHMALQSNKHLERVVVELQNGHAFVLASRHGH
jgi:hypothetical protein